MKKLSSNNRYEVDSLRGRSIAVFTVSFVVFLALSFWVVEKTLRHLNASTPPPLKTSLVRQMPAAHRAPLLQPTEAADRSPAEDLEAMKSHDDEVFARLGWSVDRKTHQAVISDELIQHLIQSQQNEVGK